MKFNRITLKEDIKENDLSELY